MDPAVAFDLAAANRQPRRGARASLAILALAVLWSPLKVAGVLAPGRLALRTEQAISIRYNQGIAHVAGGWVLSGTDSPLPDTDVLVRTDEAFHVLAENAPAIPAVWRAQGYDHIGDIDAVDGIVYAPFEQADYSKGFQVTARYDASSLRFLDAVVLPQHENSFVAVDRASMIAYSMDHFDGDALLRYDVKHGWRPMPALSLSLTLHHTQGASIRGTAIWICTSDDHNDVYQVSLATGQVKAVGQLGHPGGEGEGIDVTRVVSGDVHAMVIDPGSTKVWVEHFGLPTAGGGGEGRWRRWIPWLVAAAAILVAAAMLGWLVRRSPGPSR